MLVEIAPKIRRIHSLYHHSIPALCPLSTVVDGDCCSLSFWYLSGESDDHHWNLVGQISMDRPKYSFSVELTPQSNSFSFNSALQSYFGPYITFWVRSVCAERKKSTWPKSLTYFLAFVLLSMRRNIYSLVFCVQRCFTPILIKDSSIPTLDECFPRDEYNMIGLDKT